jgi:hypothetical protein
MKCFLFFLFFQCYVSPSINNFPLVLQGPVSLKNSKCLSNLLDNDVPLLFVKLPT